MTAETQRRRLRTEDLNRFRRLVSQKTIETYQELQASVGSAQAISYEDLTGGTGAQYAGSMHVHVTIDFLADVLKVVKDTLTGDDLNWYLRLLRQSSSDFNRQTQEQLKVHESVGRVLLGRGLFTFTKYRNTICVF